MNNSTGSFSVTEVYNQEFHDILQEFLTNLAQRFPERSGISQAKAMNAIFSDPTSQAEKRSTWAKFSLPILSAIMNSATFPVTSTITREGAENPLIKSMGIDVILCDISVDAETKASVWKYLQVLTVISHQGTSVVIPEVTKPVAPVVGPESVLSTIPIPVTPAAPAPVAVAPVAAVAASSSTPDFAKIAEGLADSLPKVMEAFTRVMEKDGGNNPMAQMMKQFMNPNQLQPGFLNNVAATMMQSDIDPGVMGTVQQETGVSADDIMAKLAKLDRLEKAHAKRKSRGG